MIKFCSKCGYSMDGAVPFDGGFVCPADDSHIHWQNPIPVGVAILPTFIREENQFGLIVGKRGPDVSHTGGWGLPSGFMLYGETWGEATSREVKEEMNITVNPDNFKDCGRMNSYPDPRSLMLFSFTEPNDFIEDEFIPNGEVLEKAIFTLDNDIELCFDSHTHFATNHLNIINSQ